MPFPGSIKKFFRPAKAIVLMYHRIAQPDTDPWQLSVSQENFESHLNILAASGKMKSISELVQHLQERSLKHDCFCITFDDGYQDNYLYALPLLEKFGCPATFYIATGTIGSGEPFWWDLITGIFLTKEKLPASLEIEINDRSFRYTLENNGELTSEQIECHTSWHWPSDPPTQRCKIYLDIWMYLRDLPSIMIKEAVHRLKEWSGIKPVNSSGNFPMSRHELQQLSENKYTGIGVHTVTHAALASLPGDIQETEISGCRDYLDENLKGHHRTIAFPYGNYNKDTLELVRKMKLEAAFTTNPVSVTAKSDIYQLGRFQVVDQTGEQFKKQVNMWLNN